MKKILRLVGITTVIGLTSCAAPYVPYVPAGTETASKIRIKASGSFTTLAGNFRTSDGGACGPAVRMPLISPNFVAPAEKYPRIGSETVRSNPRAGMFDSTDATRTDIVELQIAPGRYLFSLFGGAGYSQCGISPQVDLEAGRQYQLEFIFDNSGKKCFVVGSRSDSQDGRELWRTYAFSKAPVCTR
jgi:hypothetical protein